MKLIDRILAAYLIVQAIAGTATAINFQSLGASAQSVAPVYGLAGLALIAGVASFADQSWARWLGVIVFAAQTIEVITPTWMYRLFLGFRLAISAGWSQQVEIGLNFLALAALLMAASRAYVNQRVRT